MIADLVRLVKDGSFLLKIVKLALACTATIFLAQHDSFTEPGWLWLLYSVDTMTYMVIFLVLALTHVFQKRQKFLETTYYVLGIFFHWIGGIFGIVRYARTPAEDRDYILFELIIGAILICNSLLMLLETIYGIYTKNRET